MGDSAGGAKEHVIGGIGRAVDDFFRHVSQVNGTAVIDGYDDGFQLLAAGEEIAGVDLNLLIVFGKTARLHSGIGGLEVRHNGQRRQAVGVQLIGAEHDAHRARQPADDLRLRHIGDLLDIVLHLAGDGAKLVAVVVRAPQGQREDGNIVDRARLDDGLRNSGRHAVEVRIELAVDLDERIFLRRADQEAHDHQALAGAGGRVHVLDA